MNLTKSYINFSHWINSLWYFYYLYFFKSFRINCPRNLIFYAIILECWIWLALSLLRFVSIIIGFFFVVHIHCFVGCLISLQLEITWIQILIEKEMVQIFVQKHEKNDFYSMIVFSRSGYYGWFLLFYQIFVYWVAIN